MVCNFDIMETSFLIVLILLCISNYIYLMQLYLVFFWVCLLFMSQKVLYYFRKWRDIISVQFARDTLGSACYELIANMDIQHYLWAWWRHQMETFSALLAFCAENSPVTGEFPAQMPVRRSFDVFFDLRPNKRLGKQSRGWWFEAKSHPLWRHCNKRNMLRRRSWGLSHVSIILVCCLQCHW